jgi:fructokinase
MDRLPEFVAAGEALTDLIAEPGQQRWNSQVGGSTWNVARAMAALGVPSALAGAISRDVFGGQLWRASEEAGLDLRFIQRVDRSPLLAFVHEIAPPAYFFVGDDSADLHFDASLLPPGWQLACRWAHFGGISLAREPLASKLMDMAEQLKAMGVRISYDPNFRLLMDARYDTTLARMTALADVVKVSEEDLAGLFRTADADRAFPRLQAINPHAVYLYTKGAQGASLHTDSQSWQMAAPRIDVRDTVGAGDASIAALAYSMMRHPERALPEHLGFSVCAGAAACLGAGASPPSVAQIEALMAGCC